MLTCYIDLILTVPTEDQKVIEEVIRDFSGKVISSHNKFDANNLNVVSYHLLILQNNLDKFMKWFDESYEKVAIIVL